MPTCIRADIFLRLLFLSTSNGVFTVLNLEDSGAIFTSTIYTQSIHSSLQRIILPSKQVISMLSVTGAVTP